MTVYLYKTGDLLRRIPVVSATVGSCYLPSSPGVMNCGVTAAIWTPIMYPLNQRSRHMLRSEA